MSETMVAAVVEKVINDCTTEAQFDQFIWAVQGDRGWEWLFSEGPLTHTFVLPPPPVVPMSFTEQILEPLLQHVRMVKNWELARHTHNGQSLTHPDPILSRRHVYLAFLKDLLEKLGKQMEAVRYLTSNVVGTWTTEHEGGIGPVAVNGATGLWELTGDTSAGWLNRATVFTSLLPKLTLEAHTSVSQRLARITRQEAQTMFQPLVAGSGSCLVGVLVAELRNEHQQIRRFVSAAANMCGNRGAYVAHTRRGQGSQIHMEIFLFERLGAYLANTTETYTYADVGIIGLKTSGVVAENAMCGACEATQVTQLNDRMGQRTFGVCFLG